VEQAKEWSRKNGSFVTCWQESWRAEDHYGLDNEESDDGWTYLWHGRPKKRCHRGSEGVGIFISPEAKAGWMDAGGDSEVNRLTYGNRILATRINVEDSKGRKRRLFIASAYAPQYHDADEMDTFYESLQECFDAVKPNETLVMSIDANAALGVRNKKVRKGDSVHKVLGPHGIHRVNKAGKDMYELLAANELCCASTFFESKRGRYATWFHPATGHGFQNDHMFVRQRDLKLVYGCSAQLRKGANTDHLPVRLNLSLTTSMAKRRERQGPRPRVDRSLLQEEEFQDLWLAAVERELAETRHDDTHNSYDKLCFALKAAAEEVLMVAKTPMPSWFQAAQQQLWPAIEKRDRRQHEYNQNKSKAKHASLVKARKAVKIEMRRAINAWHTRVLVGVNALGEVPIAGGGGRPLSPKECWEHIRLLQRGRSRTTKKINLKLRKPDGSLCATPEENAEVFEPYLNETFSKVATYDKIAIELMRQRKREPWKWLDNKPSREELCAAIRKMKNGKSAGDTKIPAEFFKALMRGGGPAFEYVLKVFMDFWESGSYHGESTQPEEEEEEDETDEPVTMTLTEARAFALRMEGDLAQGVDWELEFVPNPKSKGQHTPKPSWARYSAYEHATCYSEAVACGWHRAQRDGQHADQPWDLHKGYVRFTDPRLTNEVVAEIDELADANAVSYIQWMHARLKILPKKGDLSLCKNWRAICLLDIASKVLSCVLVSRMQMVMEAEGLEMQFGFRQARGCADGSFTLMQALRKRHEHNLESWGCFIDLVKAFDTVSREALFRILQKFGLPDHFINIVIRLHKGAKINIDFGSKKCEIDSTIGVRQGACEGPILFLFIMQAALETMDWPVAKPQFCTSRTKCKTTGENHGRKIDHEHKTTFTFELWASLFADDCAVLFESREDMIEGMEYLYKHLRRFGLHMHLGRNGQASKTESMFFPRPGENVESGDQSNFICDDGIITFCKKFKYLGSYLDRTLKSDVDIDERIKAAAAAFGALRVSTFTNKRVDEKVKGRIFVAIVLSILLYGSECWCMTEDHRKRLTSFYNARVRSMCRVNKHKTIKYRITTKGLLSRLDIRDISFYYNNRIIRWIGHVSRMSMDRLPRQLMTSWVQNPRPLGRPQMTYGATMFKALKSMGIPTDWEEWTVIAVERDDWKQVGRIGYKAWKKQKDEYILKRIFKAWRASIPQPQQPARQRQQQQPRQPTRRSGRIASRSGAAAQPAAHE